eukprot:g2935.t1
MGDWKKPRRVDEDALSYFRQLEGMLDSPAPGAGGDASAAGGGSAGGGSAGGAGAAAAGAGGGSEERDMLLVNVHEELRGKEASMASDKLGSVFVEKLLRQSTDDQLRAFVGGLKGYYPFLVCNRFSSHVMQTLLALAGPVVDREQRLEAKGGQHQQLDEGDKRGKKTKGGDHGDDDDDDDDDEDLDALGDDGDDDEDLGDDAAGASSSSSSSMGSMLTSMFEELRGGICDGTFDPCASHVIRTLLSVLAGDHVTTPKRSQNPNSGSASAKKKKKKKKKKQQPNFAPTPENSGLAAKKAAEAEAKANRLKVPPAFPEALFAVVDLLLAYSPHELRDMACHNSASPVLQLLLKLLPGLGKEGNRRSAALVERVFGWKKRGARRGHDGEGDDDDDEDDDEEEDEDAGAGEEVDAKTVGDVDAVIKDAIGSHCVENILAHLPDATFEGAWRGSFAGPARLALLATHPKANFVVQALMACARTRAQAEAMLAALVPACGDIRRAGAVGVFWRLAELSAEYGRSQKELCKGILKAYAPAGGPSAGEEDGKEIARLLGLTPDAAAGAAAASAGAVGGSGGGGGGGERAEWVPHGITMSVPGAYTFAALLRFNEGMAGKVLKRVLEGLLRLDAATLKGLACSSVGSRYVLDAVLDAGGPNAGKTIKWAKQALTDSLAGQVAATGADRVGAFVVQKLFKEGDLARKAAIAEECSEGHRVLDATPAGRIVLKVVRAEQFGRDRRAWEKFQERLAQDGGRDRTREMFADILGDGDDAKKGTKERGGGGGGGGGGSSKEDGGDGGDGGDGSSSTKRKRKRKRKNKSGGEVEAGEAGGSAEKRQAA